MNLCVCHISIVDDSMIPDLFRQFRFVNLDQFGISWLPIFHVKLGTESMSVCVVTKIVSARCLISRFNGTGQDSPGAQYWGGWFHHQSNPPIMKVGMYRFPHGFVKIEEDLIQKVSEVQIFLTFV